MNYLHTIGLYLELGQLALSLSSFQQLPPSSERERIAIARLLFSHEMVHKTPYKHHSNPPENSQGVAYLSPEGQGGCHVQ